MRGVRKRRLVVEPEHVDPSSLILGYEADTRGETAFEMCGETDLLDLGVIQNREARFESDVGVRGKLDAVISRERVRVAKEGRVATAELSTKVDVASETSAHLELNVVETIERRCDEPIALEAPDQLALELGSLPEQGVEMAPRERLERLVLGAETEIGLFHVDVPVRARRVAVVDVDEIDPDAPEDGAGKVALEKYCRAAQFEGRARRDRAQRDVVAPSRREVGRKKREDELVIFGPSIMCIDLAGYAKVDAFWLFERLLVIVLREKVPKSRKKGEQQH